MTQRSEILGKKMFAILPDNPGSPDDPAAEGVRSLHASLLQVLKTNTADATPVQKYDIRKPESEGGGGCSLLEPREYAHFRSQWRDSIHYPQGA